MHLLSDKASNIKLHLWVFFLAADGFLSLLEVIDFSDLHTQRFHYHFERK